MSISKCPGKIYVPFKEGFMFAQEGVPAGEWSMCIFCKEAGCGEGLKLVPAVKCDPDSCDCGGVINCDCNKKHERVTLRKCGKCKPTNACGCGAICDGKLNVCEQCKNPLRSKTKYCDYCAHTSNICPCGNPL
jgi:hypothetical protein